MPLDRTEEDDDLTLPSAITSKGARLGLKRLVPIHSFTFIGLLGFDGIILEVTNASHVVSVTLF
jgi:hypothetical protein